MTRTLARFATVAAALACLALCGCATTYKSYAPTGEVIADVRIPWHQKVTWQSNGTSLTSEPADGAIAAAGAAYADTLHTSIPLATDVAHYMIDKATAPESAKP